MSSRITKIDLNRMLLTLNTATTGGYELDSAFGGYKLVRNTEHGQKEISALRGTAREVYYQMYTAYQVVTER